MNDKDPHKKMRRFGELCGYFYGRRFFGLDSIMSDKDSNHLILELQEARHLADSNHRAFMQANKRCVELMDEVEKLRDLLRWRDAEKEKPEPDSLVLVNLIEKFSGRIPVRVMRYSDRCEWIDPNAGIWMDKDVNYWQAIGPLPGEGGGDE